MSPIPKFVPADLDYQIQAARRASPKKERATRRLPVRESQIEKYLVQRVKELGGECRKVQFIGRRGAPDRIVMLPLKTRQQKLPNGVLVSSTDSAIWIELKAPGVKPEAHQVREHERMRKMGQRVEVVDSYERVDEVLS